MNGFVFTNPIRLVVFSRPVLHLLSASIIDAPDDAMSVEDEVRVPVSFDAGWDERYIGDGEPREGLMKTSALPQLAEAA